MIAETGHFALIVALCLAVLQGTVPLAGAARGQQAWMRLATGAALAQVAMVMMAFTALALAYIGSDFSVRNVFENSHSLKPMLYKVTGVWGNHEGSLVLWVLVLALFALAVALRGADMPLATRARVLGVLGLIGAAFLAFCLFTSNPFERLVPAPVDGRDLNPILQDPGLAFHPPFLYLGYVGLSVTFAFAVAALIEGKVDRHWAHWVRPFTLASWTFLTAGIALGSWWAYYELGWGGWWFWDPVENASFMPWLAATALLHSTIVTEKREALKSWTILLAILAFSLSLLGTFLVRSGVLTSVHAFAVDPARGIFILGILTTTIGGALVLFAMRAPSLRPGGLFAPISREGALVLNNLFLAAACFTVLTGTLYPLLLDVGGGETVSVGPPYYEIVFVPLMVPLMILMALGMMAPWKRADLAGVLSRLKLLAVVSLATWGIAWWWTLQTSPLPAFGIALSVWIGGAVILEYAERIRLLRCSLGQSWQRARRLPVASHAMNLAHFGLAVLVAGITASSAWQTEIIRTMAPGDRQEIAGYTVTFEGTQMVAGPNYHADRGIFEIMADGRLITRLAPERRSYLVQTTQTTEAAIHTTLMADLYVVMGDAVSDGTQVVRLYHNPLVPWIWGGALLMATGGAIGLLRRRAGAS